MTRAPGRYDGLTVKQAELLSFVRTRCAEGRSPSFEEMKEALDLKSKSGVHRLISALEERGYVTRLPNRARALIAVDNPQPGQAFANSWDATSLPTAVLVGVLKTRGFSFGGQWR